MVVLVYCQPYWYYSLVVIRDFVLFNVAFWGAAAVLGGGRMREMPFDEGSARDEGYVVELDYLKECVRSGCCVRSVEVYFEMKIKPGLHIISTSAFLLLTDASPLFYSWALSL
jgi:hypothetical protein